VRHLLQLKVLQVVPVLHRPPMLLAVLVAVVLVQ
tara:strand:+ start:518 stop:619 length:102 start_codon:yes stop_codon:yes gene_type:complete